MSRTQERALSYHDVLLRRSDVDLLAPGFWLNDQIIAFFFEFLAREVHPDLGVALIPPSLGFLLLNSDPSEAAMIFEALKLPQKQMVVLAVNDNPDVEAAAGGSHWSCLIFHRPSNSFRHYDSCRRHNGDVARELAGAAAPLVRQPSGGSCHDPVSLPAFVEVAAAPQQRNSSDCGMYVLAVARALCCAASRGELAAAADSELEQPEKAALAGITPAAVLQMRQELADIIQRLAAEQQQQ